MVLNDRTLGNLVKASTWRLWFRPSGHVAVLAGVALRVGLGC